MRFCAINKIGKDHMDVHLVLTHAYYDAVCFYKIDNLANRFFVHHARLYEQIEITDELKKYMAMAYEVGARAHVMRKRQQ